MIMSSSTTTPTAESSLLVVAAAASDGEVCLPLKTDTHVSLGAAATNAVSTAVAGKAGSTNLDWNPAPAAPKAVRPRRKASGHTLSTHSSSAPPPSTCLLLASTVTVLVGNVLRRSSRSAQSSAAPSPTRCTGLYSRSTLKYVRMCFSTAYIKYKSDKMSSSIEAN